MKYKKSYFNSFYDFDNVKCVYNSFSGFFAELDKDTYDFISEIEKYDYPENNPHFEVLKEKGVIIPALLNEKIYFKGKMLVSQHAPGDIISLVVAVTRKCNYRCVYCFQDNGSNNYSIDMSRDTQDQLLDFIKELKTQNPLVKNIHISWFGGEPLMNIEAISYISESVIEYCDENSLEYTASIVTNGSLLTKEFISSFSRYHISSCQITLDGDFKYYTKMKRTGEKQFNNVINNIFLLPDDFRIGIRFNCNCSGNNFDSIKSILKKLSKRLHEENKNEKMFTFYLAPIDDESTNEMYMSNFINLEKEFIELLIEEKLYSSVKRLMPMPSTISCGFLLPNTFGVDADGTLCKCERYIGDADEYKIGDLKFGMYYNDIYAKFSNNLVDLRCESCAFLPVCKGGCFQKRVFENIHVNCENFKEHLGNILYYNKLLSDSIAD